MSGKERIGVIWDQMAGSIGEVSSRAGPWVAASPSAGSLRAQEYFSIFVVLPRDAESQYQPPDRQGLSQEPISSPQPRSEEMWPQHGQQTQEPDFLLRPYKTGDTPPSPPKWGRGCQMKGVNVDTHQWKKSNKCYPTQVIRCSIKVCNVVIQLSLNISENTQC